MAGDIQQKVGIKVTADASQAKDELRKLDGEQKKLTKNAEAAGLSWGKALDGIAVGLAKFNLALGGIEKGIRLASKGWEIARSRLYDHARAQQAVQKLGEEWIKQITEQTRLYVAGDTIIQTAIRATRGELALNRSQFELATKVAERYAKQGENYTEVLDGVIRGMQGQTRALKDYGVHVKETGTEQEKFNDLIRQLKDLSEEPIQESVALREMRAKEAAIREMLDAWADAFTEFFTWLVKAMTVVAKVAQELPNVGRSIADVINAPGETTTREGIEREARAAGFRAAGQSRTLPGSPAFRAAYEQEYQRSVAYLTARAATAQSERASFYAQLPPSPPPIREPLTQRPGGPGGPGAAPAGLSPVSLGPLVPPQGPIENVYPSFGYTTSERMGGGYGPGVSPIGYGMEAWEQRMAAFGGMRGAVGAPGDLRGLLGMPSIEQLKELDAIMAQLADTMSPLGASMSLFTSALTAGIDAAISGGEGMLTAIKKAVAGQLKALAIQSAVKAAYELAEAIANYAVGNAPGGTAHLIASGKYAAAAAAAGGGAALLGGGGGEGGAGAGGGSVSTPGGGWVAQGPTGSREQAPVVVNIYGPVGDSRATGDYVARAVRSAQRSGSGRDTAGQWD